MICDIATYRELTGDQATLDARVTTALQRAQRDVEDHCERKFESAVRTEIPLWDPYYGRWWVQAYPVTEVVSADGSVAPTPDALSVFGVEPDVAVTYTGGFAAGAIPMPVVRAVAELALRDIRPVHLAAVPAGATSVSADGESISGGILGGSSAMPPAVKNTLRPYRHIRTRPGE